MNCCKAIYVQICLLGGDGRITQEVWSAPTFVLCSIADRFGKVAAPSIGHGVQPTDPGCRTLCLPVIGLQRSVIIRYQRLAWQLSRF